MTGRLHHRPALRRAFLAAGTVGASLGGATLVGAILGGLTGAAQAQSAVDDAARQARQFQGLQSYQQRLRQLEELQRSNRAPSGDLPTPPVPETTAKGGRCFQIARIKVDGAHLVDEATIRATVSPWQDRCLGLAEINSVLKAVTFLYVERGYVASRAYLQSQNLSNGELAIAITEGKLEGIRLNGQADDRHMITSAFPGLVGGPVNLHDLEQGLDQINRLRSNNATIAIAGGQEADGSVLDVTNNPGNLVHTTFGSDNLGATVSGIYQSRVDLAIDDLFGFNDLWQFGYQRSMNRSPASFSQARPNSDTVNASVSVPYGYWTAGIDSIWSQYHSAVAGQVSTIDTSGGSLIVSPYVTRVIQRDQISKTSVTGRLTWKDTENAILGTRIDVASRTLSIAGLELNHSRQLWGGEATASLGYQRGLAILGAFNDTVALPGAAQAEFSKYTVSLGYSRLFDGGAVTPIVSSTVYGQWSPDRLFGTEQMSFGGYASIRGVQDAILFADKGALARNEVSLLLPASTDADLARSVGRIEPYAAVDVGYAAPVAGDPADRGGTLVGAALGLRNRGGRLGFDVWYAKLLVKPAMPLASLPPASLVQGRVSVSF